MGTRVAVGEIPGQIWTAKGCAITQPRTRMLQPFLSGTHHLSLGEVALGTGGDVVIPKSAHRIKQIY